LIQEGKLAREVYDSQNNYPLESMLEFIQPDFYRNALASQDYENIDLKTYGLIAKQRFLALQKEVLANIHVEFDQWFSELELYQTNGTEKNKIDLVCEELKSSGTVYEEESALWFRAKDYNDERDRVLKKSDGSFTYLTGDLAYHQNKFTRGFDKLITVWGADHHGQIPSLKGGMAALGLPADQIEIVLIQLVSLTRGEEEVKMSKRSGDIVTVTELVNEVGIDAFRYFLVENQASNRIVFDLDLAKKQDKDNPVYYIQYAHARSSSIIRNLTSPQIDQEKQETLKAILEEAQLKQWQADFNKASGSFKKLFAKLEAESLASTKALVLALANFPEEIKDAALARSPNRIANYLKNLATLFHQFYTHNRVIVDDLELMKARVSLVLATRITLKNALSLLGISAPEKM